jgi:hypothetical protein
MQALWVWITMSATIVLNGASDNPGKRFRKLQWSSGIYRKI